MRRGLSGLCDNDQMDQESPTTPESREIGTGRLEAFSDGVLAVIITIMVLEIRPPLGGDFAALAPLIPKLLVYVLSFAFIGIYWNNHHQTLHATRRISAGVMWSNLHLLFWLSLVPLATEWSGVHPTVPCPSIAYGFIGFMAGVAYYILIRAIIKANKDTGIEAAIGRDVKGKASLVIYSVGMAVAAIGLANGSVIYPLLAYLIFACVSVMWFIPDRRLN
jgi:uncharacterized membrane protein